jgi:hypothetical protein
MKHLDKKRKPNIFDGTKSKNAGQKYSKCSSCKTFSKNKAVKDKTDQLKTDEEQQM